MTRSTSRLALFATVSLLAACGAEAPEPDQAAGRTVNGDVVLTEQEIRVAGLQWSSAPVQTLSETVTVPGSVVPPDTAQASIGSITEGRVARVHVVAGDRVRSGDPLVEVHSHEVSDAQAAVGAAEAELDFAREAAARAERLHEVGAISLEELQGRSARLRSAEAEMERAHHMLDHLHPSADGNATSIAPRDGVVFSVEARQGQAVVPGDPLLMMGATDPLWVTAYVPEGTSAELEVGQEVEVRFRALQGVGAWARLVRLGEYVDPDNRSVEARFELIDPPAGVRPGSFASVDIATSTPFDGVDLPQAAAVRIGGEDVVFILADERTFRPVPVTVVPLHEGRVAVTGLPADAEVVTVGAYFLKSVLEVGEGEGE